MSDRNQKSTRPTDDGSTDLDQLALLGGESLKGSGFESELPEPNDEWRDPQ